MERLTTQFTSFFASVPYTSYNIGIHINIQYWYFFYWFCFGILFFLHFKSHATFSIFDSIWLFSRFDVSIANRECNKNVCSFECKCLEFRVERLIFKSFSGMNKIYNNIILCSSIFLVHGIYYTFCTQSSYIVLSINRHNLLNVYFRRMISVRPFVCLVAELTDIRTGWIFSQ